ncbi:hypothetical protein PISL3812_04861 [Talaromyces islandicus]|uniref:SnoaL-like domain-containing protein n=1 Tax=Talaromyces islandicus TaxID=28573 RepID=A0A0U1LYU7_TALIS|nr:hypothetical protein PISL3812_04861 [Talaromyces islandicus]
MVLLACFGILDIKILETILSDDCYHEFAPSLLKSPGPFSKQGFLDHHSGLDYVMAEFPIVAKEYINSESNNSVTVWATSRTIFREDAKDVSITNLDYEGEYMFLFTFGPRGEKIVRTIEFLDSKATADGLMVL